MLPKPSKVFLRRRWIELLLLFVLCLLPIGLSVYLTSGRPVSVGQFVLSRRDDGLWSYKNGNVAAFSASGAILQTGRSYCIGPFCITHWRRDWKLN
jgi:hypothetical protein